MSRGFFQTQFLNTVHRYTNGVLQTSCKRIYHHDIMPKAWYSRDITEMTTLPHESTMDKLVMKSYEKSDTGANKVTVVGTGEAAVASTFALLAKGVTDNVCMIGVDDNKLKGEEKDLAFGSQFLNNPNVTASKEHSASANSMICIVAAGTEKEPNESVNDFTTRNTGIVRAVVPQLMKYSPEAVYLVASDPVDLLTYQAWRTGGMPKSRIMGTGTNVDSARFRYMMADRLGVDPSSCFGLVVGRNPCNPCGPCGGGRGGVPNHITAPVIINVTMIPVWSCATASGVRLMDLNPKIGTDDDPEQWQACYDELFNDQEYIRKTKGGYTWAVALSVASICEAILTNSLSVHPVSTYAKGEYSIPDDVFMSLPCVLGINGIVSILRLPLSTSENQLLRQDARGITETQEMLKILQ